MSIKLPLSIASTTKSNPIGFHQWDSVYVFLTSSGQYVLALNPETRGYSHESLFSSTND